MVPVRDAVEKRYSAGHRGWNGRHRSHGIPFLIYRSFEKGAAIVSRRKALIALAVIFCLVFSSVPAFAATSLAKDPYITVVSPTKNAVMKTGSVLVSVKMTAPRTIRMSFYEETKSARRLIKTEKFSSSRSLSYYTRQLTGLDPGVYCVNISTLNSAGRAIYASEIYVKVQKRTSDSVKVDVFNSQNSSSSFWATLLKKLLG